MYPSTFKSEYRSVRRTRLQNKVMATIFGVLVGYIAGITTVFYLLSLGN